MNIPASLKTYLDSLPINAAIAIKCDLITVTLVDGSTTYRWTTFTAPIVSGGHTYFPAGINGPGIERSGFDSGVGFSVDTFDVMLHGDGGYTINSSPLPLLAVNGYFDGATMQLDHLLGPDLQTAISWGPISKMFFGYVGDCEPQGPNLLLHCNTITIKLQQLLPNNVIQPACNYAVYDPNCGLNPAAFTISGAVVFGLNTTTVLHTSIAGKPDDYFDLGVITFTSGGLSGQSFDVLSSTPGGILTMALPLPVIPANGDTFTVFPGCDRSRVRCVTPFNNLVNFRGFPHVPSTSAGQ